MLTEYEPGYKGYITIKEVFDKDASKLNAYINFTTLTKEYSWKTCPQSTTGSNKCSTRNSSGSHSKGGKGSRYSQDCTVMTN
jgi:hypothetical protein